jgi:hypothetical protein
MSSKPHEGITFLGFTCLICGQMHNPHNEHEEVMPCDCEPGEPLTRAQQVARIEELHAKRQRFFVQ